MALTPDKTRKEPTGVTVQEKIIPWGAVWSKTVTVGSTTYSKGSLYKADRLLSGGTGKVAGVTVHNTPATANAETYTRATYPNQNMNDVRVHYYVDDVEAWQNLKENEAGWHAADGRGAGNDTTIAIEIIMQGTAIKDNAKSEDNGARLAAAILHRHGLTINDLYTHNHWLKQADAIVQGARKNCPLYILPHWPDFKAKVKGYLDALSGTATPPATTTSDISDLTPIAGASVATVEQMRAYITKLNASAPDLAAIYLAESAAEGIRGDVAFAQSCLETGNFKFGGDVKPEQNNYCGLGATGNGVAGNSFPTPQIGIRAQIQHLKAYANAEPLSGEIVDPRFAYVARGAAQYVEWLGIPENPNGKGWAAGKDYGAKILKILAAIIATDAPAAPKPPAIPEPPQAPAPEFDNTPHEWERKAVEMAISRGILQGDTTGNLHLHAAATRADVLVFLDRCGVL